MSANPPSPIPASLCAVEALGTSIVFYIRNSGGFIEYLVASAPGGDSSRTTYRPNSIKVNGKLAYAYGNALSAVVYMRDGKQEIRVFYISSDGDGKHLRELCQTNGGEWSDGSLNDKEMATAEDTLLSASVSEERQSGNLKVFFQRPNSKRTAGVLTPLDTGLDWYDRLISGDNSVNPFVVTSML